MYELFVLGQLMEDEKHGYLLQERLKTAVGPIRQISSGTLYPLLARLLEKGWISRRFEEQQDGGRPRKIYGLTESGRERFQELMCNHLEHSVDTELIFHFKMTLFEYVTKDVQLACLEQYLEFLEDNLEFVTSQLIIVSQKQITETKRIQLMRMLDHRKSVGLADIEWVTKEIERVEALDEI